MADALRAPGRRREGIGVQVVGPAPAYVARRAERWRCNVVLRGADPVALLDGRLGAPWSVDVDPGVAALGIRAWRAWHLQGSGADLQRDCKRPSARVPPHWRHA